ncbi:hypothetical protein ES288_D10G087300v1 [Gossypium darwinii]|nr:hypothetical protein ES288_D10G087300v1 [Gossypium darwinii]
MKAWKDTCSEAASSATLVIPKGKQFLVHPLIFTGPCKSGAINVMIPTEIQNIFPANYLGTNGPDQWNASDLSTWLAFEGVTGLSISGFGTIDGRGKGWWDRSCRYHPGQGCFTLAPTALRFQNCNNLKMLNTNFHNSPQTHVLLLGCQNVELGFLNIQSPGTSPNTDGIHIQFGRNVSIHNSQIADGDDCISIGDKTYDVKINDIKCGPGHGVSIGSLGRDGEVVQVNNIKVKRVSFHGTTNGVRIKTWQTGRGLVQNVTFTNINFTAVENPIIIDQYYCDKPDSCKPTVRYSYMHKFNCSISCQISMFIIENLDRTPELIGTSQTEVAINLNCSNNVPCSGITLDNVRLVSATHQFNQLVSSCNHVSGLNRGIIEPKSCLKI